MKRAFTLVEMLIVVAILAVLMSIVFRLGSVSSQDSRRTATIVAMQKIENCLSGYYAAFGSYPPVKLYGTQDIFCAVDPESGDQDQSRDGDSGLNWTQVNAACRAQPFGCEYPPNDQEDEAIQAWSQELQFRAENSSDYPEYAKSPYIEIFKKSFKGPEYGEFNGSEEWDNPDWKAIKLFKFGVMSFLLPRYLFMMGGDPGFCGADTVNGQNADPCAQWSDNNDMPCDPFEGCGFDESENGWATIREWAQTDGDKSVNGNDLARVANIPSQAVCARWMPNLENLCASLVSKTFFGICITDSSQVGLGLDDEYPPEPNTHNPPGRSSVYKNATITIHDGWGREFYYYSPAPYQTYTLWSAGANGYTFPPWMSLDSNDLSASDKKEAMKWKSDDIMQMSH